MIESDTETRRGSDWLYLRREICRRTWQPFSYVPFVFYVLSAIIVLGCLGIWVEVIKLIFVPGEKNYENLLTALATFFPALIGSSSHQLILASTGKTDKVLVSFGYVANMLAFCGMILISVFHSLFPSATFWAAVVFSILAIWLWWITNGDDPTYKSVPIDAASGGNTSKIPKGNTEGFRE